MSELHERPLEPMGDPRTGQPHDLPPDHRIDLSLLSQDATNRNGTSTAELWVPHHCRSVSSLSIFHLTFAGV
jgi:hypothetical protein